MMVTGFEVSDPGVSLSGGREDLHDDASQAGHGLIDFIDANILSVLEKEPFHSADSLAERVGVSYSTIIRHPWTPLELRPYICAGCAMS
jgi:hypothetical protein